MTERVKMMKEVIESKGYKFDKKLLIRFREYDHINTEYVNRLEYIVVSEDGSTVKDLFVTGWSDT